MFAIYLIAILVQIEKTNALEGFGICSGKSPSGDIIQYCCSDYEEKNETCIPCEIGYTSENGGECKPCSNDKYGIKCAEECMCTDNTSERCDHVVGCVDIVMTTATLYIYSNTVEAETVDNSKTITEYSTTEKRTIVSSSSFLDVSTATPASSDTVQSSHQYIIYYTLSVAVLVLTLGICFLLVKYRRLSKKRTLQLRQSEVRRNESESELTDDPNEIEDGMYEIIDDAVIEDFIQQETLKNVYLDVISGSNSPESTGSKNIEGFVYYINKHSISIEDEAIPLQDYKNAAVVNDVSSSSDSSGDVQEYLNPYQQLNENWKTEQKNNYTKVLVHKEMVHSELKPKPATSAFVPINSDHLERKWKSCSVINDQSMAGHLKTSTCSLEELNGLGGKTRSLEILATHESFI